MNILFILFVLLTTSEKISAKNSLTNEERLYHHLFNEQDYSKWTRPVKRQQHKVEVNLTLEMLQIVLLDEKEEYMKASVWPTHSWFDSYLKWKPEQFENITIIRVPRGRAWNPDIVLLNNIDGKFEVSYECNLLLSWDGRIQWMPPSIYHSSCLMDVLYFPYDVQKCPMKFVSVTYDESQLDIKCETNVIFDPFAFSPSAEWQVMSSPCVCDKSSMPGTDLYHSAMVCEFRLRRLSLYYTINFVVPIVILTFLAILGFYLPSETNEKIPLCTSILLSVTMLLLIVVKNFVPPTSLALPLICQYLLFSMIMVSFSIIATVVVLNFHHKPPLSTVMPKWAYRFFVKTLPKWLAIGSHPHLPHSTSASERLASAAKKNDLVISNFVHLRDTRSFCYVPTGTSATHLLSCCEKLMNENVFQNDYPNPADESMLQQMLHELQIQPSDLREGADAVTYISARYIKNDLYKKIRDEWHLLAKVVDRILLVIYTSVIVVGSLLIFFQVPSLRSDSLNYMQNSFSSVPQKVKSTFTS